jgi:hypothetical protein
LGPLRSWLCFDSLGDLSWQFNNAGNGVEGQLETETGIVYQNIGDCVVELHEACTKHRIQDLRVGLVKTIKRKQEMYMKRLKVASCGLFSARPKPARGLGRLRWLKAYPWSSETCD